MTYYRADSAGYEQLSPTATVSEKFDTISLQIQTLTF